MEGHRLCGQGRFWLHMTSLCQRIPSKHNKAFLASWLVYSPMISTFQSTKQRVFISCFSTLNDHLFSSEWLELNFLLIRAVMEGGREELGLRRLRLWLKLKIHKGNNHRTALYLISAKGPKVSCVISYGLYISQLEGSWVGSNHPLDFTFLARRETETKARRLLLECVALKSDSAGPWVTLRKQTITNERRMIAYLQDWKDKS